MIDDPTLNPAAWQSMLIAGLQTPGKCSVRSGARVQDFDKKKGKGAAGTTTTYTGTPAAEFEVDFEAWRDANNTDHFQRWDTILVLLKYAPEKGLPVIAVDVYHPALADVDISSCVATSLGIWEHAGKGLYKRTIKFLEYRPPPPVAAVSTPSQAASPDPTQGAQDLEILNLQNAAGANAALAQDAWK